MAEFASKGVAGAGLGLGIAGTALGLLNGGWGNLFGGYGRANAANDLASGAVGGMIAEAIRKPTCSENSHVTRYELQQEQKIAELQSQVALRDANTYGDQKMLEMYKYIDGQLKDIRQTQCDKWAQQGVINAKFESAIDVLGSQVASINTTIGNLTKTVIPNANVCPGWGNVCVRATGCSTVDGCNCNGNL